MSNIDTLTLKSQAKRLRRHLASNSITLSHSQALEAIAAVYGFNDWNTASALSPKPVVYPATDETVEQLAQRFWDMGSRFAKRRKENPDAQVKAADVNALSILLHQIGVAKKAADDAKQAD